MIFFKGVLVHFDFNFARASVTKLKHLSLAVEDLISCNIAGFHTVRDWV